MGHGTENGSRKISSLFYEQPGRTQCRGRTQPRDARSKQTPNATIAYAPAVLVGKCSCWALALGRAMWGISAACLLSVSGLLCTHGHRGGPARSGGAQNRRQ